MIIVWSKRAGRNLEAIGDHIARDNPRAAKEMVSRIVAAVDRLALLPELGRVGRTTGTRELVIPSTRYIVVYRVRPRTCGIVAVLHSSQSWPKSF